MKDVSTLRMEIIRDVFVFACYTGHGYAELSKLAKFQIYKGDEGSSWNFIDSGKNRYLMMGPILPQAKAILEKYENFPTNRNREKLLPVDSNHKMNI